MKTKQCNDFIALSGTAGQRKLAAFLDAFRPGYGQGVLIWITFLGIFLDMNHHFLLRWLKLENIYLAVDVGVGVGDPKFYAKGRRSKFLSTLVGLIFAWIYFRVD